MRTVKTCYRVIAAALAVLMSVMLAPAANACSRVTWLGPDGAVITGRSMDWPYSFHSTSTPIRAVWNRTAQARSIL